MILVDTSVWVDHLRRGDRALADALAAGLVLAHPFVVGEIACCSWARRSETLALLRALPVAPVANPDEALGFIERHRLAGRGVGYVDVHLLASAALAGAGLWTRDQRLSSVAVDLRLLHSR